VAKSPSRLDANKKDLDLTPPEEIRARRIKLFVLLGAVVACVLGVAIYFAARPVGGAIKAWQSRRLAGEAFALIDQKKWSEANAKARDALVLRPAEPESWRAIARLASRRNQWPSALDWWKKVDEANRLTVEDRSDFIGAALMTGELFTAAKQVEVLLAQRNGPTAHDILLAGQVAVHQSDPALALDYAQRVLADKTAKPYDILSAATLVFSVTSPSSPPYASAWQQIEAVARDPKNPASLDALVVLAREEALPPISANRTTSLPEETQHRRKPLIEGTPSTDSTPAAQTAESSSPPSQASPDSAPQTTPAAQSDALTLTLAPTLPRSSAEPTMTLTEIAEALENHPDAQVFHKLLALEVRARQDPILTDQYVADAIERFGRAARQPQTYQGGAELADETLAEVVGWLNKIGRPAKTLEVLTLERAGQRDILFLQYLNTLAALQRWNELKDLLISERFPIEPIYQHMYLAVAQAHLGSAIGATNEWQRALEVANTTQKLIVLAKYAEQNSAVDIADSAFAGAIKITPKNREAYAGRLRLAMAAADTVKAQKIAAEIAQLWPDDAEARNQETYLRLLLGASGDVAETAEREARVLVAKEPQNWLARATLGLARLRLGRSKEALAAIREPRVTGVEPPGALAVRVAIMAANGYEDGARNDARLLAAKPLLPEERALIAPLVQ